jgi:predicted secreted hydrolase
MKGWRGAGWLVTVVAVVAIVAGCAGSPILANPPAERATPPMASPAPSAAIDPQPLAFPADDGAHHRLTEWWYYTGHLVTDTGRKFGFEDVIFRAERGSFPVSWASHLALTDEQGNRFLYGQRTEIGPQVDRTFGALDAPPGFDLAITGADPSAGSPGGPAWTMTGASGQDRLVASLAPSEAAAQHQAAGFGLDLALSTDLPPVLHDSIGFVSFGPAGGSYYYSRPRMAASGTLQLDSETFHVTGQAWFDHQWGDFISIGGGWDWFAVNLADGSDLTLSLVRDATGGDPLVYGTLVNPDGTFRNLARDAFTVTTSGTWTSPKTGATYPAGWHVSVPSAALEIDLRPTIPDQELDTRPSTGVVYWEGSQIVIATKGGEPVGGEAYVELTGYGPSTAVPVGS